MLFFFRIVPWNGLAVLQGNQEPLVVKTGRKNPRWLWGEQVCRMWHFFPFTAMTLLAGWQEEHPACKKLIVSLLVVTIWLELCTSYGSSSHHQLRCPYSSSSEFNVVDCLAQMLGQAYRGGTLLAHGSNFGRMPFLPALVTQWVPLGVEPRLTVHKSVALTTEPRLLRYP